MSFEVDRGIPLPPRLQAGGRVLKYPLDRMEVGDSFFCLTPRVRESCSSYGKRAGRRFTVRKWKQDDGTNGFRVWRTA